MVLVSAVLYALLNPNRPLLAEELAAEEASCVSG
jgi:hypothetical protein